MPAATRLFCLALWFTAALVALLRGANTADGVDWKKSSASWVPSVNAPMLWAVAFSFWVGASPERSERPWVWGSKVSTT